MPDDRPMQSDLVPLSLAASLAYFQLAGISGTADTDEHLRDVLDLAVVALSYVAPIHWESEDSGGTSVLRDRWPPAWAFLGARQPIPD